MIGGLLINKAMAEIPESKNRPFIMQKNNTTITALRWIVGVFFIISGLLKVNDPNGLSYKMQEYFDVWGVSELHSISLTLAIVMNVLEILAGVAIILGYAMNFFSWFLLLLIIAFTFLTGYSALSGKFKTCGCMGDCLPVSPLASFLKDIVLLLLILIIFQHRKKVRAVVDSPVLNLVLLSSTAVFALIAQLYVLKNLPLVDCLPYRKGNHLLQEMQAPPGSVPDSIAIVFKYKKDGKIVEFGAENFPADFDDSYEYVDRTDKVIRKGNATPKIEDFALRTVAGEDVTQTLLEMPGRQVLVFAQDFEGLKNSFVAFKNMLTVAAQKNIPVRVVSPLADQRPDFIPQQVELLKLDPVVNKTVARVNPVYMLLDGDKIIAKRSYNQMKEFIGEM